ncbi:hypothetical protein VTK73DRAFT_4369 [Phialemonium thermophilum]|uniref:methylated diphthine methylhydrolase n=1 Tax=Phialemonium thermophilum TaxID=223376 RepID=A0ABR3Y0E0_9PEZI
MEDASRIISSACQRDIELPPSCLEFCPAFPSYFLVGTYHLQKDEGSLGPLGSDEENYRAEGGSPRQSSFEGQKRTGSIVIYQVVDDSFIHIHTELRPSAILDLHFQPASGQQNIFGTVSSTGTLDIFRFPDPFACSRIFEITHLGTVRIPGLGEEVLFLSFAWHPSLSRTVAITTSRGGVHVLKLSKDYRVISEPSGPVITHSLEAWCVVMSDIKPPSEHIVGSDTKHEDVKPGNSCAAQFDVLSGGDDSTLRYLTCQLQCEGEDDESCAQVKLPFEPVTVGRHYAGVTAILSLPGEPAQSSHSDLVITGSYDDHIRVFSITPLHRTGGYKRVKMLAEANLGGGVWRLRLVRGNTTNSDTGTGWRVLLLASCMHAGARIVELRGSGCESCTIQVLGRFEEHKSMNYASDVQPDNASGAQRTYVSSSFYDQLICLWRFEAPLN